MEAAAAAGGAALLLFPVPAPVPGSDVEVAFAGKEGTAVQKKRPRTQLMGGGEKHRKPILRLTQKKYWNTWKRKKNTISSDEI